MFITAYLPPLASIAACAYMVVAGHTGWAVAFFVLAILTTPSIEGKVSSGKKEDE